MNWDASPRIIGHRGSPHEAPENTLASFRAAVAGGARAIELDARLSSDGVVVVHHDAELGRVLPGTGEVRAHTAEALAKLGLPTLAEVFHALPGILVDVELKADTEDLLALPEKVAEVVRKADALDRALITSFDPQLASEYAARTGRDAGLITIFPVNAEEVREFPGLRHVCLAQEAALEPGIVEGLRAAGLVVHAWTVNDTDAARALRKLGVAGIITDRPREMAASTLP